MRKPSDERRQHRRVRLPCPTIVTDQAEQLLAAGRSLNVSDGGVYLVVPIKALPPCQTPVQVKLTLPRPAGTRGAARDITTAGRIVRHQALQDDRSVGMAIEFDQPLPLTARA